VKRSLCLQHSTAHVQYLRQLVLTGSCAHLTTTAKNSALRFRKQSCKQADRGISLLSNRLCSSSVRPTVLRPPSQVPAPHNKQGRQCARRRSTKTSNLVLMGLRAKSKVDSVRDPKISDSKNCSLEIDDTGTRSR
jgi:hypothetical protein